MTSPGVNPALQMSDQTPRELSVAARKLALRRSLLLDRQQLPEVDRAAAASDMADMLRLQARRESWRRIAVYLPWRYEPDLRALWREWQCSGLLLALPVVVSSNQALEMRLWTEDTVYARDAMGLPVPAAGPALACDTWLIPCVGVGPQGERLGAGKGLYDRSMAAARRNELSGLARPRFIGLSFGHGQIAEPFAEAHDQPLDAHLTELGWRSF